MAKYSQPQLAEMARQALAAKAAGDDRYGMLVLSLVMRLGMSPRAVERHIADLAGAA